MPLLGRRVAECPAQGLGPGPRSRAAIVRVQPTLLRSRAVEDNDRFLTADPFLPGPAILCERRAVCDGTGKANDFRNQGGASAC
jgi:hypothetical protein